MKPRRITLRESQALHPKTTTDALLTVELSDQMLPHARMKKALDTARSCCQLLLGVRYGKLSPNESASTCKKNSQRATHVHLGGCQNPGPFLDPSKNTAPNIQGTPKGIIIFGHAHLRHQASPAVPADELVERLSNTAYSALRFLLHASCGHSCFCPGFWSVASGPNRC